MQKKVNTEHLEFVFADNGKYGPTHKKGYNGIAKIRPLDSGDNWNYFVDMYAGLNHEHYFDNNYRTHKELFPPRTHPMDIFQERTSDGTTIIKLVQNAYKPWFVHYEGIFKIYNGSVDFTLKFTPQKPLPTSDFLGVFFASYINHPQNKGITIHVDGKWHYYETMAHGIESSIASIENLYHPTFSDKLEKHWLFASYAPIKYNLPLFYGINNGIMLCYMFQADPMLYFAHSPSGGGKDNPAWDFFIIHQNPQPDRAFSISGRLIVKPFISESDLVKEYALWAKKI